MDIEPGVPPPRSELGEKTRLLARIPSLEPILQDDSRVLYETAKGSSTFGFVSHRARRALETR
jgi:hypothetical protein